MVTTVDVLDKDSVARTINTLPALGTAGDSASLPTAFSTEGKAQLGALTETAPGTDTASSGLNGRLQRIAQRLTSLIALVPSALGANGGFKIEGVSSGQAVPVSGTVSITSNSAVNVAQINGVTPLMGNGASGTGAQRVTLANDSTGVVGLNAGEAFIGSVGGRTVVKDLTMSLDTSAYASGDVLADTQQLDGAFRKTDGTGELISLTVVDKDDQKAPLTIYLLDANVSMGTENAAPSISDTNAANILAIIPVATLDYYDLGGVSVAFPDVKPAALKAVSGTDDLYVAIVNGTSAPTYTASGVVLRIGIRQD